MKKLFVPVAIILIVLIGIIYFTKVGQTDSKVQTETQDISVIERPVINHTSNILGLKEVLNTVGCMSTTTKQIKVALDKNHSLSFSSIICKTQSSNDYFMTDYKNVYVKDGTVYGAVSGKNKEILKYWIFDTEAQIYDFVVSKIKSGPDAEYCDVSMYPYGDTKEWFTEYHGPYTGNGVEPAENCGELFGLHAGRTMIFSNKNVLIKSEIGTEGLYRFDPESVLIK